MKMLRALRDYLWRILVSLDVLANTITGGDDDATISLRTAFARQDGELWGKVGCRVLDLASPGHCDNVLGDEEAKEGG